MVASTAPPTNPQPMLSYAERAKKAQRIKSPIDVPPSPARVIQSHPPPPPPSDPSTSSYTTSAASSAPISSSATSVDETPNQATRSSSPAFPVSSATDLAESTVPLNCPADSSPDPAVRPTPTTSDPVPSAPPKSQVNVWNQRKEKMAAARASSIGQKPNLAPRPSVPVGGVTSTPNQPSTSSATSKPSLSTPVANGAGNSKKKATGNVEVDTDDPFTVKIPPYLRKPSPTATPNLPDPKDWPEVGKSLTASSSLTSQSNHTDIPSQDRIQNGVVSTPKKSERKWIPAPKEELQATADAQAQTRRGSRSQSRHKTSRQTLHPSTSTPNANVSSRSHSGHTSAAQSASHSRVQSRSGSVHSSPKVPRGRRLPPDEPASNSANNSLPKTPDPSTSVRLSPLPAGEGASNPNRRLSVSNSLAHSHRSSPASAQLHVPLPIQSSQSQLFQPSPTLLSQRVVPFHPGAPIFYPQGSGSNSPHSHSHSQPLSPSTLYPSIPPQGPYAPYGMFNPYEYPPTGPSPGGQYVPWAVPNRAQPLSGSHSPMYHPPHSHQLPPHPLAHLPTHHQIQQQYDIPAIASLNRISSTVTPSDSNNVATEGSITSSVSLSILKEKMVFGSIEPSLPTSPALAEAKAQDNDNSSSSPESGGSAEQKTVSDRALTAFAIGVDSSETMPPRLRSRTRDGVVSPGGASGSNAPVETPSQLAASTSTSSDVKWRFGTTSNTPPDQGVVPLPVDDEGAAAAEAQRHENGPFGQLQASVTMPAIPLGVSPISGHDLRGSASFVMPPIHTLHPHTSNDASPSPQGHSPQPLIHTELPPQPYQGATAIGGSALISRSPDPDLEVRDFGYGFGDASGSGYIPLSGLEKRTDWEQGRGRDASNWPESVVNGEEGELLGQSMDGINAVGGSSSLRERDHQNTRGGGDYHHGRGRRGGFPQGRGYGGERGGGSYSGGGRRGRGLNGFSRGYGGRGGYSNMRGAGPSGVRTPNFSMALPPGYDGTPPSHFQSLPMDGSATPPGIPSPYYLPQHPAHPRLAQFLPPGAEAYPPPPLMAHSSSGGHSDTLSPQPGMFLGAGGLSGGMQRPPQPPHLKPPVPVPMSTIAFPLDSTRYYLLGQLEYYLSPQNMAQDFFLRQKMDERGWIPIPLIASFKRVTQLTTDVQLVRDVLTLSSLVQVRGSMVRMGGWEQFVLPDAQPSKVEEQPLPYPYQNLTPYYDGMPSAPGSGMESYLVGYSQMPPIDGVFGGSDGSVPTSVGYDGASQGAATIGGGPEDEEDEDDVEFVMGEVVTWSGGSPDQRT